MMRKRSWNLSEVLTEDKDGSIHERRGGAMMRKVDYSLARMSGMLDFSRDETATCPIKRHEMIENRGFLDHRGAVFRP